ncbi:MAG: CatA-like O-acetyltransferase [Blautia marasmi]
MFYTIDYENWERKEIFERFAGYTYNLTAEADVTDFLEAIHEKGYKFYPSICWCIANTVNSDVDFRYAKVDGAIGYYERLNPCYTLMRKGEGHLFTHMVTDFDKDFDSFYKAFLEDKEKAGERQHPVLLWKSCPGLCGHNHLAKHGVCIHLLCASGFLCKSGIGQRELHTFYHSGKVSGERRKDEDVRDGEL